MVYLRVPSFCCQYPWVWLSLFTLTSVPHTSRQASHGPQKCWWWWRKNWGFNYFMDGMELHYDLLIYMWLYCISVYMCVVFYGNKDIFSISFHCNINFSYHNYSIGDLSQVLLLNLNSKLYFIQIYLIR